MATTLTGAYVSIASLALLCCCVRIDFAQGGSIDRGTLALTVPVGAPLHIVLTKSIPVTHAGVPVAGKVIENVYVFDHLVIPAGSRVIGQVTKVDNAPRKERALAIANGNFTPLRHAHVDFNALVEADGNRVPLQANVMEGAPRIIHIVADGNEKKKKGRAAGKVELIHQHLLNEEAATIKKVTAPGKVQRLKAAFIARLPYHRPSLPAGTNFTAELKVPLTLSTVSPFPRQSEKMGEPIPPGSLVHVRLVSPLSSATDHTDALVRAVVSEPLYSPDHALILPEGAELNGTITQVVPARRFGRSGELRFVFQQLQLPSGMAQQIEASVQGFDTAPEGHMQFDAEGAVRAVHPKCYVMTAFKVFLAATPLNLSIGRRGFHPGSAPHEVDYPKAGIRGGLGMGLAGAIVSVLAHSRPVSSAFGLYGLGWRVYSHFVVRGADVVIPKNSRGNPLWDA